MGLSIGKVYPLFIALFGVSLIIFGNSLQEARNSEGILLIVGNKAKEEILLEDSYALFCEDREGLSKTINIHKNLFRGFTTSSESENFPDLTIEVADEIAHAKEKISMWIKEGLLRIEGMEPIAVKKLPFDEVIETPHKTAEGWEVYAYRGDDAYTIAREFYIKTTDFRVRRMFDGALLKELPFIEALSGEIAIDGGKLSIELFMDKSLPNMVARVNIEGEKEEMIHVDLRGSEGMMAKSLSFPYLSSPLLVFEWVRKPAILFIENLKGNKNTLYGFNSDGEIFRYVYLAESLGPEPFDNGFGGYGIVDDIPLITLPASYEDRKLADFHFLARALDEALGQTETLSSPMLAFKKACEREGEEFLEMWMHMLFWWDKSHQWIFPKEYQLPRPLWNVMEAFQWEEIEERDARSCYWVSKLLTEMERADKEGIDSKTFLFQRNWPYLSDLRDMKNPLEIFVTVSQQMHALSAHLKDPEEEWEPKSPTEKVHYLTAYMRGIGFEMHSILFPKRGNIIFERLQEYAVMKNFRLQVDRAIAKERLKTNAAKVKYIASLDEESETFQKVYKAYQNLLKAFHIKEEKLNSEGLAEIFRRYAPFMIGDIKVDTQKTLEAALATKAPHLVTSYGRSFERAGEGALPLLSLVIREKEKEEKLDFHFDAYAWGRKWPILNGKYRARLQPQQEKIPYSLELIRSRLRENIWREAPLYENIMLIKDKRNGKEIEVVVSTERGHETADGYHFYRAGNEKATHIRVEVKRGRNWMTLPGLMLLATGIALFIRKRYV